MPYTVWVRTARLSWRTPSTWPISSCYGLVNIQRHQAKNHPFRLQDVQLWAGQRLLNIWQEPAGRLPTAMFAGLTFTTQKNGVPDEQIGHGRSGTLVCENMQVTFQSHKQTIYLLFKISAVQILKLRFQAFE
ncbi:hypothetical protein ACHAWF_011557 [Thalassiosira exigua]